MPFLSWNTLGGDLLFKPVCKTVSFLIDISISMGKYSNCFLHANNAEIIIMCVNCAPSTYGRISWKELSFKLKLCD